jgi:hypothetical protein
MQMNFRPNTLIAWPETREGENVGHPKSWPLQGPEPGMCRFERVLYVDEANNEL